MTIFNKVRDWSSVRGMQMDKDKQYQRLLQEVVEIHDALVDNDDVELIDAIGDTLIVLTNFASAVGYGIEWCAANAFNNIEKRKGLVTDKGDFVRYAKLSPDEKAICDIQQGNPGEEYFSTLPEPKDFKGDQNG